MKQNTKAGGFGIVELLVLFVGIGVIGFVGWYVWQAKANANSSYSATANIEIVAPTAKATTNNSQYLVIKELGIKLPLTSDIQDLGYTYNQLNGTQPTGTHYLHFSTASIATIPNSGSTCNAASDPLGTYTVYSTRQANEGTADSQVGTLEATVSGHYIYYKHVQYGCGDTTTDQNKVAILIAPLLAAVKKAQPA